MNNSSDTGSHEFSEDGIRRIHTDYPEEIILQKRKDWQEFVRDLGPYPDIYSGKGIVICAGGAAYLTCAWINIKLLRRRGCSLPIELWHQKEELDSRTITELGKLNVTCRNFADCSEENIANGYRMKPVAILNSSFKEILFLDADNNCLKDPSFLFEDSAYKTTGAVFWPDYWKTQRSNPIWQIVGSDRYEVPEQESGQILINKEECWKEINLCLFFNMDPFYYQILWGDKDTFKFSWMALNKPFHMIRERVAALGFRQEEFGFGAVAMLQHDFSGEPLFVHSNLLKWHERTSGELFWNEIRRIQKSGQKIQMKCHPDFKKYFLCTEGNIHPVPQEHPVAQLEKECLKELEELRKTPFYANFLQRID